MEVGVDAYVSVEDVTDYLTARGTSTAWDAAEEDAKEAAIVEATSYLDAAFSWIGQIADQTQTLGWPRVNARDREGRWVTGIPTAVKDTCAELANLALAGRLAPMDLATGGYAVKRDQIGDVQVDYDTNRVEASYRYVTMLLGGLYKSKAGADRTVKLVRT